MIINNPEKLSESGVVELKRLEGYTPVAKQLEADRAGVITGGYGDTNVKLGETHTEPEWSDRFRKRLPYFERGVYRAVTVRIVPAQFDALTIFTYNVGFGDPFVFPQIDGLLTSTLLRLLNAGDYEGAAREFRRWNKSAGQVRKGLITRRAFEESLFRRGMAQLLPKAA